MILVFIIDSKSKKRYKPGGNRRNRRAREQCITNCHLFPDKSDPISINFLLSATTLSYKNSLEVQSASSFGTHH